MTFIDFLSEFLGNDPSGGILYGVFGCAFVLLCVCAILSFVFGFITLFAGGNKK